MQQSKSELALGATNSTEPGHYVLTKTNGAFHLIICVNPMFQSLSPRPDVRRRSFLAATPISDSVKS